MAFATNSIEGNSAAGVAEVDISTWFVWKLQACLHDITTGTGTVTIEVEPTGTDEWQPVENNTIDLSDAAAPKAVIIEGKVDKVRATSDQSGDVFTLLVGA